MPTSTAPLSPADTFTADASAAGYMNPNRIRKEYLPLFVRHNQHFFREADMTIAPMVLDWDQPSPDVKDAFRQFAPDGFATIVIDMHGAGGKFPAPQVWKGMPVLELINDTCNFAGAKQTAEIMARAIKDRGSKMPGFYFFRCVWVNPTDIAHTLAALRRKHPELNVEVLDPHTFFALFKKSQRTGGQSNRPLSERRRKRGEKSMKLNRRKFIKSAGAGGLGLAASRWLAGAEPLSRRPNLLYVFSDQQFAEAQMTAPAAAASKPRTLTAWLRRASASIRPTRPIRSARRPAPAC